MKYADQARSVAAKGNGRAKDSSASQYRQRSRGKFVKSLGLGHPVSSVTAVSVQHYAIHTDSLPPSIAVVYTGNRESGDAFVVADDDGWNNCELEEARG